MTRAHVTRIRHDGRIRVAGFVAVLALAIGGARRHTAGARLQAAARQHGTLPPTARHGLIHHLPQYPAVSLATPRQRARARLDPRPARGGRRRGSWRDVRAATRAGYDTRTRRGSRRPQRPLLPRRAPRGAARAVDLRLHAAEGAHLRERARPPARPRRRDVEHARRRGRPTPAGPILRWHSHVVCKEGKKRGLKPPASGECPPGSRLTQGASEMLHVWFTRDLRSAFAISAPRPELCARVLPRATAAR